MSSFEWPTKAGTGSGTVTSVSVVTANGFAGTVATDTTTPAITLTTTITAAALAGNGTAITAAHVADASHDGYLSSTDWSTFNSKQAALTLGDLTDVGTDGITIGSGAGSVIGTGTTISQHVADASHNGYLSSTDWSTFNSKQATVSFTTFGSSPSANGGGISAGVITLQPADATHPGGVTTGAQTIAGAKTFSTAPILSSLTASQAVVTDASKNLGSLEYTAASTASTIMLRDASANTAVNDIAVGGTLNVTSTTTLNTSLTGPLKSASGVVSASAVDLTSEVTGILPVGNGGTGQNSLTANNVVLGNGSSAVQFVAPGTSGNVLKSNGSTWTSAPPINAKYQATTGQSLPDGTFTTIIWDTVVFDTNSAMNTSTGVYTVPVAGKYRIFAAARGGDGEVNSTTILNVRLNGTASQETRIETNAAGNGVTATVEDILVCSVNDTIDVQISQSSAAGQTMPVQGSKNWILIQLIA